MPQVSRDIPHGTDLEKAILEELRYRVKFWEQKIQSKLIKWREDEEKVLAFVPETEVTRKRKNQRKQGVPDYTTIQIPYSYAVVMSALTYITSVFFARSPVFQYSGRHGESAQQVQAIEALIDYQVLCGYMLPTGYTWVYDSLKYGYGVVGLYWEEKIEMVSETVEQPVADPMGMMMGATQSVPVSVPYRTYAGNKWFNIQPQDFVWDAKYPAREFQRGEYAGYRCVINWNEIVRGKTRGYYINTEALKERERDFFARDSGSDQLERAEVYSDNIFIGADQFSKERKHPTSVAAYELVVELIPTEWELGPSDWPEKWVFTVSADFSVLMRASPLGAMHCSFPFALFALEPEGYGLTIRGFPEVLDPIQTTVDWLLNSHFFNVRAALNNKFVVDPSRVVMKDVLSPLPGGIVRLKPEAYGTDTKLVMTQMQIADVTAQHLPNFQLMMQIGERISGVNDSIMGMMDAGGRKTATEVRTSTSLGINRLKTLAEFASASGFDPLSRMMVQNTQQYYDMEMKLRVAGDLLQSSGKSFIMVNPEMIAGFYDFVPVDGTLPIDRFAQVNLWKELFQAILAVPQIGLQYDLAGIFQWVAQLAGLKNITQFRVQLMPDQLLQLMAQQGNSVAGPTAGAGAPKLPKSDNKQGYQQPITAQTSPMEAMVNGSAQ